MAETVGFEPTKELPLYTLSRRAPSTTRPRLRMPIRAITIGQVRASSCPLLAAQATKWHDAFMKSQILFCAGLLAAAIFTPSSGALAQEEPEAAPSPNQIVEAARQSEWVAIDPEDLLVMTLAPDAAGTAREVVIQLMPAPFSQGWVGNIRKLARAKWYDDITVNRVQDNYVVQWGDPGYDNPESGETEQKSLPDELKVMAEYEYSSSKIAYRDWRPVALLSAMAARDSRRANGSVAIPSPPSSLNDPEDDYSVTPGFVRGWALTKDGYRTWAPVHCYGMVGVGRGYSPDTGSGAELYTVIGHAPRHLDRNIALVGRIISGMEHLSSLPRGSGALGFYTAEEADKRTPILSVRVASDLPDGQRPQFEYLSTESDTFAQYAEARANRRDPFFIVPAGGADICNIPVPVRAISAGE